MQLFLPQDLTTTILLSTTIYHASFAKWAFQFLHPMLFPVSIRLICAIRAIVDEAYAGDIVGLFDPGIFSIGDTVCTAKHKVQFPAIPMFAPEMFAKVSQVNTLKRKQFVKGMEELAQEGAIQIFRELGAGMESVIVGAVGVLQFEVLE